MQVEVLDLAEVGSGWTIADYDEIEKAELEKRNALYRFKGKKEFIDFVEYISAVHLEEYKKFGKVINATRYLQDLNYDVRITR